MSSRPWLASALLAAALVAGIARAQAPLDTLKAGPFPRFRPGHTLPPLSRWGWTMSYDVRIALCEHWGYALEFGGYATPDLAKRLDDPNSVESKLCALTASDPKRYPLCVLTVHGDFGEPPDAVWTHDTEGKLPEGKQVWSTEAPTEVFAEAGRRWAEPLKKLRERCPIALILNGGEYALTVHGFGGKYWEQDPGILKAKGDRGWFDYLSDSKARQELPISEAFRAAVPDRLLYVYYTTSVNPHQDRWPGWIEWGWDYHPFRKVSDIPSGECYYNHFNSGWTGDIDCLTLVLNMVTNQVALGEPLSYNWVNGGWTRKDLGDRQFSDPEHYLGFLKCFYTAGMVGGCAGYFAFPVETDPHCIEQMLMLGHAHALFSWLEDDLRHGDLLPGPNKHRWSKGLPAMELPTGDPDARVLVRRQRDKPLWLLTAWAAGGPDRDLPVDVPELGRVTLHARACGSVYRARIAEGKPALTLLDPDGMNPSAGMEEGR
ncbi:MAG: hypothetical protein HYU66_25955 [Armatimonadetes bacterium]|nr:hypothetical protein [Armatimonadota bacterium]